MAYSTCCGAYSRMPEIDICPECREHCDWEDEDDEDYNASLDQDEERYRVSKEDNEPSDDQINNNHNTEGGISFSTPAWNGR